MRRRIDLNTFVMLLRILDQDKQSLAFTTVAAMEASGEVEVKKQKRIWDKVGPDLFLPRIAATKNVRLRKRRKLYFSGPPFENRRVSTRTIAKDGEGGTRGVVTYSMHLLQRWTLIIVDNDNSRQLTSLPFS